MRALKLLMAATVPFFGYSNPIGHTGSGSQDDNRCVNLREVIDSFGINQAMLELMYVLPDETVPYCIDKMTQHGWTREEARTWLIGTAAGMTMTILKSIEYHSGAMRGSVSTSDIVSDLENILDSLFINSTVHGHKQSNNTPASVTAGQRGHRLHIVADGVIDSTGNYSYPVRFHVFRHNETHYIGSSIAYSKQPAPVRSGDRLIDDDVSYGHTKYSDSSEFLCGIKISYKAFDTSLMTTIRSWTLHEELPTLIMGTGLVVMVKVFMR